MLRDCSEILHSVCRCYKLVFRGYSRVVASSVRGPDSPLSSDLALDKPRPIPSPRQIHPLYGEKAGLLGYCDPLGNAENFPPAPNIVVEGGRIEFVRPSQDGTTTPRRNTMSRGSQTFNDESEKSDPAKTPLFTQLVRVVDELGQPS
ncbi:hypothetical protein K0M31_020033 [Melipona bicolor]|uniref:Uncharacterized protein n=1 Tax=Melipona bicolor TaxID=60889 RepID=A0AA40G0T1_9HYME|nr:hypothetical protein K0M31_020033 [Melipona bicolor]